MKLILVMVTSLDGRSTHGKEKETHSWSSREDQKYFLKIIEKAQLLIMGSKTYEVARETMHHDIKRLRVIITKNPEKYRQNTIPNQLEFTNESPIKLIERLKKRGYTQGFLLGGSYTNTGFLKHNLVSEFWQTLEPKVLGIGNGIVDEKINLNLQLISYKKINTKGTLLLKYQVLKE